MVQESRPNLLARNIESLPGVGQKFAEALAKQDINTVFDLCLRLPKAVVPEHETRGLGFMREGYTYVAKGEVLAVKISGTAKKKRLEAILQDDTGRLKVIFFGPAVNYAADLLKQGQKVTVTGEAKNFLGRLQMVHPKVFKATQEVVSTGHQVSYSQVAGLMPPTFKRIITSALSTLKQAHLADHLDLELAQSLHLSSLEHAILGAHNPGDDVSPELRMACPHFRRLAFEEISSFYLRLLLERAPKNKAPSLIIKSCPPETLACAILPFNLTNAQRRVITEIIDDFTDAKPAARLLQGDVGSGKTAVSACVAWHVLKTGAQVAVMAPTEILSEQLFAVYSKFFANHQVNIALISASTKAKERRLLAEKIARKEISVVVGTHALLSEDIVFNDLGLLIIDEQHRFGVKQRASIIDAYEKSQGRSPHLLVMSATPIPRTLALTIYGDLDISVIDERPPGRLPIHTQVLSGPVVASLEKLCERVLASEQKAFIVFPLVEESEHLDLENATRAFVALQNKFGPTKFRLLHGKMKPAEKLDAMTAFKNNEATFLVATTVVEVGVDIPDATCMIIVHAERFGMAQLHQLRGRVGRKDLKSYCFLLTDVENRQSTSAQRLHALCQSQDGFELAQTDLKLRGAGDLLGTKQSGLPNFQIFNHQDFAVLIEPAKRYAKQLMAARDKEPFAHLFAGKESFFS
jgi:ATP-dependent DNA helicase RecG